MEAGAEVNIHLWAGGQELGLENGLNIFSISTIMTEILDLVSKPAVKFSFSSRSMRQREGSSRSRSRLEARDSMMQILNLVSKVEIGISQGTALNPLH